MSEAAVEKPKKRIGEVLIEKGVITEDQLRIARLNA